MSTPAPLLPRHKGQKRCIDWLTLIGEVVRGETAVTVAARYGKPIKTLQGRVRRWRKAHEANNEDGLARAEGLVDGRMYSRTTFTQAEERKLADEIRAAKTEAKEVERSFIVEHAVEYHGEIHGTHALRSITAFVASPQAQWITRFKLRNDLNTSQRKVRAPNPNSPQAREAIPKRLRRIRSRWTMCELDSAVTTWSTLTKCSVDISSIHVRQPA